MTSPPDLRPLTLGELFDRAFVLYRRHFWLFVGITAVPGVFALLMTLAQAAIQSLTLSSAAASQSGDPAAAIESFVLMMSLFGGMMLAILGYWVVYTIALGATTFAVSEIYLGRPAGISDVYGRMRGRIGSLLLLLLLLTLRIGGVAFLGVLIIGFGAGVAGLGSPVLGGVLIVFTACTVFGICAFLALRYSLSISALVLERLPATASIRRSIELTDGRLGRVFLMVVCTTFVTYAAWVLFQGPFLAAAFLSGIESSAGFWLNVVGAVSGTIGTTLTAPLMIIGLALIYYDARIREEGFDLELSLSALEAPAEEA